MRRCDPQYVVTELWRAINLQIWTKVNPLSKFSHADSLGSYVTLHDSTSVAIQDASKYKERCIERKLGCIDENIGMQIKKNKVVQAQIYILKFFMSLCWMVEPIAATVKWCHVWTERVVIPKIRLISVDVFYFFFSLGLSCTPTCKTKTRVTNSFFFLLISTVFVQQGSNHSCLSQSHCWGCNTLQNFYNVNLSSEHGEPYHELAGFYSSSVLPWKEKQKYISAMDIYL